MVERIPGNNFLYTLTPKNGSLFLAFFVVELSARNPDAMASSVVRIRRPSKRTVLTCGSNAAACLTEVASSSDSSDEASSGMGARGV